MSYTSGELIIRDVSEFENVKSYSIEKLENGDRSIVCNFNESSICPEHFPGQTVLDIATLFAAAPALLEALELTLATMDRLEAKYGPFLSVQGTRGVANQAIAKAKGN